MTDNNTTQGEVRFFKATDAAKEDIKDAKIEKLKAEVEMLKAQIAYKKAEENMWASSVTLIEENYIGDVKNIEGVVTKITTCSDVSEIRKQDGKTVAVCYTNYFVFNVASDDGNFTIKVPESLLNHFNLKPVGETCFGETF